MTDDLDDLPPLELCDHWSTTDWAGSDLVRCELPKDHETMPHVSGPWEWRYSARVGA